MTHDDTPAPTLHATRTGPIQWTGRNERGAEVLIGKEGEPGVFSPGELLAIAVAACAGMSAESRLTWELGEDAELAVGVERVKNAAENRYERLLTELVVAGEAVAHQDPSRRERMLATAAKAVEKHCTVSRTLAAGAETDLTVTAEVP